MSDVLFRTPPISAALDERLSELDTLRTRLGDASGTAGPWLGALRRQVRAATAESSIEIEGFKVPEDETIAIAAGGETPDPDDQNRRALSCYARAMDHVGVMASDPGFRWLDRVILDLHFDACYFQKDKDPGRYRQHGIEVTSPDGGRPAYVGPPQEEVAELMGEVVDWLEEGDLDAHVAVRAAMAHLHMVSVHPFRDGNGRVARIVQSLVLARDGLLAPEFGSIEEYLRHHTDAYYATLREVQGGGYLPAREASPWVSFCIEAHLQQARARLVQLEQAGARWTLLEDLVERRGWPDRLVVALEQSLFGFVDRGTYADEAGVSVATASADLRRALDADLIARRGKGRTTRYVATDALRRRVEELVAGAPSASPPRP